MKLFRLAPIAAFLLATNVHAQSSDDIAFCKALADTSHDLALSVLNGTERVKAMERAKASTLAVMSSPSKVEALVNLIYDRKSGPATLEARDDLEDGCLLQQAEPRKPGANSHGDATPQAVTDIAPQVLIAAGEQLVGGWATLSSRGTKVQTAQDLVKHGVLAKVPEPFTADTPLKGNNVGVNVTEDLCRAVLRRTTGVAVPEIPKWQPAGALHGCYQAQGAYRFFSTW